MDNTTVNDLHFSRGDWIKYCDARGVEHITEIKAFSRTRSGGEAVETPHGIIKVVRIIERRSRSDARSSHAGATARSRSRSKKTTSRSG
jgi:hypothetical protein